MTLHHAICKAGIGRCQKACQTTWIHSILEAMKRVGVQTNGGNLQRALSTTRYCLMKQCASNTGPSTTDRRSWVLDLITSTIKNIAGLELPHDAPLMNAGLDSLGELANILMLFSRL